MEPEEHIIQPEETKIERDTVSLSMNYEVQNLLTKLISWGKFVGVMNIIQGSLYALTIFLLLLPTAAIGVIYIIMGIKLVSTANQFQVVLHSLDSHSLQRALSDLKSFIVLNGVMFIIGIVLITVIIFLLLFVGGTFMEFFRETLDDFALANPLT